MGVKLLIAFVSLLVPSKTAKVESLEIHQRDYRHDISKSTSHNLAASICTMPCLKNLKLALGLSDEFYTALREGALSLKVESLEIKCSDHQLSESASQNLVASICTMPCLKVLQLSINLQDRFFSALRKRASSLKIESLDLSVGGISELGSQSLAASICSMPCLRSVRVHARSYSSGQGVLKATLMKDVHVGESLPSPPPPSLPSSSSLSSSSSSSSSSSRVIPSTCQINIEMGVKLLIAFVSLLVPSKTAKVESLEIQNYQDDISKSATRNLVASICTIPCLKNLKLVLHLSDEFYTTLRKGASSLKVKTLEIECSKSLNESASQNLGASICIMPCLQNVKLAMKLSDEFYTALREGASSLKTKTLEIKCSKSLNEVASHNLGVSICTMPCLENLKLLMDLSDGFCTALREGASSLKVKTLEIECSESLNESASQNLVVSICTMPCLMNVKLHVAVKLSDEFYTALREGASSLKVESLEIECSDCHYQLSESTSQTLVASICTMPCLKNLKLVMDLSHGFYTALREGASSLKVKQMHLMGVWLERSDNLAAFALMQNLVSLTLFDIRISDNSKHSEEGRDLSDTLMSTSLTKLNVDHDSFISLCGMGLQKRFPCIQKMTLAFPGYQTPFPQELIHYDTLRAVEDLTLHGYGGCYVQADLASLSLLHFPNLINLSLINILIGTRNCKAILESLRKEKTLKTISIKNCDSDAGLDPLCNEINAEGKMMVTVQHGWKFDYTLEKIFREIK